MALTIKRGPTIEPLRIVFQGQEGVGKTTWASQCPRCIFLTAEDGGGDLDYDRAVLGTWTDLRDAVKTLIREGGDYETVVIDTIDTYERMLHAHLIERHEVDSIEQIGGGYGKGYKAAEEEMSGLAADLDALRERRRMHIILLAHTHVKAFNDPMGAPYDRYELRMHKAVAALWSGWADAILFACFDVTVMKAGKKGRFVEAGPMDKGKATEAKRVIYTSKDAAYDAKNRHNLPEELPLSWDAFAAAIDWNGRTAKIRGPRVHESWAADSAKFTADLTTLGIDADALGDYAISKGGKRPSEMGPDGRAKMIDAMKDETKRAAFTSWLSSRNNSEA